MAVTCFQWKNKLKKVNVSSHLSTYQKEVSMLQWLLSYKYIVSQTSNGKCNILNELPCKNNLVLNLKLSYQFVPKHTCSSYTDEEHINGILILT